MQGHEADIDPLVVDYHTFEDTFKLISELTREQGLEEIFFRQSRIQISRLIQMICDRDPEVRDFEIGTRMFHMSFIRWKFFPPGRPLPWLISLVPEEERRIQSRQLANTTLLNLALHARNPIDISRAVNNAFYGEPAQKLDPPQSPEHAVLEATPQTFGLRQTLLGRDQLRVEDILLATVDSSSSSAESPPSTEKVVVHDNNRASYGDSLSPQEWGRSLRTRRRYSCSRLGLRIHEL
ncbi:hypothetical protein F4809DRAFT_639732 [Biscogniauxia mediterranea]|nr:hypothetical protein F4809DRAFT_639732 [Biscogniauxia mediterranea]